MLEICSNDYSSVFLTYSTKEMQEELRQIILKFNSEIQNESILSVEIPNHISYLYTLLFLLAVTTEEKNSASESKCQSYFSLEHLNILLDLSDFCWYLRRNIFLFFFHVYLDVEREVNEENSLLEEITLVKYIYKIK